MYGVTPDGAAFLAGYAKVAIVYIPVSLVEFLVYAPMLGAGGSYISFITGNVTNMKIPVAMNAQEIAGTKAGTPESEIISIKVILHGIDQRQLNHQQNQDNDCEVVGDPTARNAFSPHSAPAFLSMIFGFLLPFVAIAPNGHDIARF